ncbi:MAG: 5,10-methylenetetrahydrofolate reductase [Deltaproteobacteria bacterium]|nr:5,10-methylenetetrahydrofolate reductase [Deltaproteobacteria bacterium]
MATRLQEKLEAKEFVITGEAGPPKGVNVKKALEEVEPLKDYLIAYNVTDNQASVMRVTSLVMSYKLIEKGLEPIFQITCRDRNRLAIQSEILSAYVMGIRNVLCLTGDHVVLGDHPEAMPVFDLDSVSVLQAVQALKNGKDLAGEDLDGAPTDIFQGAVVAPGADPLEPQLIKFDKKVEAGARFFQTQGVFSVGEWERFYKHAERAKVPVMLGIILLKSAAMGRFMNENVAGVNVPKSLIKRMAGVKKKDRPKVSIEIAAELIRKIRPMCQGVHIMALGWDKYIPDLLKEAELL